MTAVQSWLSTSTSLNGNDDEGVHGSTSEWRKLEWAEAIQFAQDKLLMSRTNDRIEFVKHELLNLVKHEDLTMSQIMDVFKLLTLTYPRYDDSRSREVIEEVGMELIRRDEIRGTDSGPTGETKLGVTEQILGWLSNEVGHLSKHGSSTALAGSSVFVLLSWTCGIYSICIKNNPSFSDTPLFPVLLRILGFLLDTLVGSDRTKVSMKNGAIVRVRRALRVDHEKLPPVITMILAHCKANPTSLRLIPLLGIAIDVVLHLKSVDDPKSLVSDDTKKEILALYTSQVLMAKSHVPKHISTAMNGFLSAFVSEESLVNTILPSSEKALLRSPEYALDVVPEFFQAYNRTLSDETFKRALTQCLNCAKSSNPSARAGSIVLFKSLTSGSLPQSQGEYATSEILALPKAGKTSGPDHRTTLYSMLAHLKPSPSTSGHVVDATIPLLVKETHDQAISVLAAALPGHLSALLQSEEALSSSTIALIAKEMGNSKPIIRRALSSVVGYAIWSNAALDTGSAKAFTKAVHPSLENALKTISANPLTSSAGPVEGYIAAACLMGPFTESGLFSTPNPSLQALSATGTKPSFLLWDKVYVKVTDAEDQLWLLRACEAVFSFFASDLKKNETLRTQLGSVYIHLAVDGGSPDIRRKTVESAELMAKKHPMLISQVIHDAASAFVIRDRPTRKDEDAVPWNKHIRLSGLLLGSVAFDASTEPSIRQNAAAALLILSHHALINPPSKQTWIDVCQKALCDPRDLVSKQEDELLKLVLAASAVDTKYGLAYAAYEAVKTLVFVYPETIVLAIVEQIKADMDSKVINSVTQTDLAIYHTEEGKTYIDVLASSKTEAQIAKGKDAAMAKWDAETRKALASKKASGTTPALTKQQQALVQQQLEKERVVRQNVIKIKSQLERGLHLINSLAAINPAEFNAYIYQVLQLMLDGPLDRGSELVGTLGYATYLNLAECTSERLDVFRQWIGVATLRSLRPALVPTDFQHEGLGSLVLRVLHRIRYVAEQSPLDSATFSYAFPLIRAVFLHGGIGVEDPEEILEEITVALDFVRFHVAEFSNPGFPRLQAIESLLHVVRMQPKMAKESSSCLIALGETIAITATKQEIDALLKGTLCQEVLARQSCLSTLQPLDLTDREWASELLLACQDDDEQNARLARHLWEDNGLDVPEEFLPDLLDYLGHDNAYVRAAAAGAIAEAVEYWPETVPKVLSILEEFYREKAKILAPEFDQYGMLIGESLDRSDPWPTRLALAQTFRSLVPVLPGTAVEPLFTFLIKDQALGDRIPEVRKGMLAAGVAAIDHLGADHLPTLIAIFEGQLGQASSSTETGDQIQEAVVILFGRLARHLAADDPRIPAVVNRLVDALRTPSESVQIAVSECLSPLVQMMSDERVGELVDKLLNDTLHGERYGTRRGAAYGIAGVVRGVGILAFKKYRIIPRLQEATEDKKSAEARQGAMFTFETFAFTLQRLFEPYITYVLPLLLTCFGDGSGDVREATQEAARVFMANLSGYGLKLILPSLLEGLDEKQWRTKKGSIELLGMMAYCSPKQLSLSLPIVIPRLTGVLTDSHAQVRAAANRSLKMFGEVISNPEIQSLVPVLLKAMVDPSKTPNALTSLLKTSFMHYIDQSSLALVVPIVDRGLRERSAETKKKAVQIVGNLASLTDSKDFVPYLSQLLPQVHIVLVDPVPEARATAAKALGTLVSRLGEIHFPDLVPNLLRVLKSDNSASTSGVDRQGAAQGLSEVLSGLGMERMEALLPDVISNAQSPRATVREGFMSLLVYLPATFGSRFERHLSKIVVPILSGLSDVEEYVREAAMRAGRMIINNYSGRAIDLLLPELERGMFDTTWRIRQSSITLVGELMFKVSGISGKISDFDEEDTAEVTNVESSRKALVDVLGVEKRDRLLASLYLVRQDGVSVVRQSSIQIWKALVHNTPRTVREILPELINQIVYMISSDEAEHQEISSRTISELCRKFGDRIVGEIMSSLRSKATSPDSRTREGVCLTLCEIMESSTEAQREDHEDEIISVVRASLVDDEANVRTAAARAFDTLQEQIGAKAIDMTIPTLLEALRQPGKGSGTALMALREVMSVRAATVFPVLIPTLTALPMSVFNARALGALVTVAGNALSKRLTVILGALVKVLEDQKTAEELREAADEALRALLESIGDLEGLNTLMMLLLGWAKHDTPRRRVSAFEFFALFCQVSELDASLYRVDWVRQLVSSLEDHYEEVYTAAWSALDVFVKSIPKDELEPLVVTLRRAIEGTGGAGRHVAGFALPKGVAPMLPIIIAGLTMGSSEQREAAATAIGDLVERTPESAIKPFVVPFTGPLIRVATQAGALPPVVKSSIIGALTTMLELIPTLVKPFYPQLQRTFVKAVGDISSRSVREKAAKALGVLMRHQARVDPVIVELVTGARGEMAEGYAVALAWVIRNAKANIGDAARDSVLELVNEAFRSGNSLEDHHAQGVAQVFAAMAAWPPELLQPIVENYLVAGTPATTLSSQAILTVVDPDEEWADGEVDVFTKLGLLRSVATKVLESVSSDRQSTARPARDARDLLRQREDDELSGVF